MSHEANDMIWDRFLDKAQEDGLKEEIYQNWTFEQVCAYLGV